MMPDSLKMPEDLRRPEPSGAHTAAKAILLVLVLAVPLGGGFYYWARQPAAPEAPPGPITLAPEPETPPVVRYPVPAPDEPPAALPALDQSDAAIDQRLGALADPQALAALFRLNHVIRDFVVTVDNLDRKKLPRKYTVAKPAPGTFIVEPGEDDEAYFTSTDNARRYTRVIALIRAVNSEHLLTIYRYFYPLFQQAYADLGYPDRYFNDRLIAVIAHLLATPVVPEPVMLVRRRGYYAFADEKLEALSAGQKLMIRIGAANAAVVKTKLAEIHRQLTAP